MTVSRLSALIGMLGAVVLAFGCASESDSSTSSPTTPALETKADSVAARLLEAHGAEAFESAPYFRFTFAFESGDERRVIARHFWDRESGEYRVEWGGSEDSTYVALVNVREVEDGVPAGRAYGNGSRLEGAADRAIREEAYGRFVNDTYWALAPLKVFDPGVNREYVPDSSTADYDVIHLTFGDVGLTPGDEYWLSVSKETGQLNQWAYHLEGMEAETAPRAYRWTGYKNLEAPDGTVTLATRKEAIGADRALLTTDLALPSTPPDGVFSEGDPLLRPDTE